jgi:hypothetical protein
MGNQSKPLKKKPTGGEHPETSKHVSAGIADQNSSKAISSEPPDARTGHDKDGNEQQTRGKTRQGAAKRDSK